MQIRKQYSLAYQVLELVDEVEDLSKADEVSVEMNDFAKVHLKEMVDLVTSLQPDGAKTVTVAPKKAEAPISDKQAGTIKKQLKRCIGLAKDLGIDISTESDVDNLSSSQASKIIGAMFDKSKSNGF